MQPNQPAVNLAVIDDEPMIAESVKEHFEQGAGTGPPIEVYGFDRPRRLREFERLPALTHAVIDLSFGRDDIDGPESRPEIETGLDAIEDEDAD